VSAPAEAAVDLGVVARALAAATAAAEQVVASLAEAAASLEAVASLEVAAPAPVPGAAPAPASPAGGSGAGEAPPADDRRGAPPRRVPAPLAPALLEDSVEAAEHLVRVNGMVLLVDGYNVAMVGWPGRAIPDQRARLVDALAELTARTGVDAEVVFDGSDDAWPGHVPTSRRRVRVSFSPPGVEADDVVIRRAHTVPAARPVTVASSDRRVQEGARRAGANVISSTQLLAVLRR
jgi:predicted RNA-binding protein with PIN domain